MEDVWWEPKSVPNCVLIQNQSTVRYSAKATGQICLCHQHAQFNKIMVHASATEFYCAALLANKNVIMFVCQYFAD